MENQNIAQEVSRQVYLYGDINDSSALEVVSQIKRINEVDEMEEEMFLDGVSMLIEEGLIHQDSLKGLRAREPITIQINSNGGSSPSGFSIITAIENSETPVVGYVTGNCMSMAIPILASCDYKIGSEYSKFMIHDVYSASEGKFNDLNSSIEYIGSVREDYIKATAKNTKMTESQVREITNRNSDYFFSPEKAFDLGLIDLIDGNKVDEEDMLNKLYGLKDSGDSNAEEKLEVEPDKKEKNYVGKVSEDELKEIESSLGYVPGIKNEDLNITGDEVSEYNLYTDTDKYSSVAISESVENKKSLLTRITEAINHVIKG